MRQGRAPQREGGRPWWHYVIVVVAVLALGGLAWAAYAIWFSVTHVRASYARVSGLVVHVASKTDARVVKVLVRTGDEVSEGQVVAVLDQADLEAAVDRAKASLAAKESDLARAERQLELTITESAATVEEAQAKLEAARARLRQAEAEQQMEAKKQPDEVRRAQANLTSARSELQDAQATLRRMEGLSEQGAVSAQRLDEARRNYEVAEAAVEAAEAALAVAQAQDYQSQVHRHEVASRAAETHQAQAELKGAQTKEREVSLLEQEVLACRAAVAEAEAELEGAQARLSDAVLRSPVNGVVIMGPGHSVKDTEFVEKGTPVVTVLAQDEPFWISAAVSEIYAGLVEKGQPVIIRIDSLSRGVLNRTRLHGEVEKVGAATEFQTGEASPWMVQQVPLKIAFDPEGHNVKHGMTCRVWIDVRKQ